MSVIRPYKGVAPELGQRVFVADTATVIGDVELGDDVSIWYGAALRGDVGQIRIGARSNIQDNACVHMTWEVSDAIIGCDVVVGHNAVVHGATIEDGALIGIGSVILDNARIGEGAWVAAGSVVSPNTDIPKGMLARGTPAKPVRPIRDQERDWQREAVLRYLGLAEEHLRTRDEFESR
jgi:carbonic anhydrase/acetyltransferase-like protein (isoleucine patch superfamily)